MDMISICVTGAEVEQATSWNNCVTLGEVVLFLFLTYLYRARVLAIVRVLPTQAPVRQGLIASSSLNLNNSYTR